MGTVLKTVWGMGLLVVLAGWISLGVGCTVIVDSKELSDGCPDGMKACEGRCVSVEDEEYGCGRESCSPCGLPNSVERCSPEGECVIASCLGAWDDCDRDPMTGCEVNIERDVDNCGRCDMACPAPAWGEAACGNADCYVRKCEPPYADCDLDFSDGCEVDLTESPDHCGKCGAVCEGDTPTCRLGECI